jgi:hypothetical protein
MPSKCNLSFIDFNFLHVPAARQAARIGAVAGEGRAKTLQTAGEVQGLADEKKHLL